MLVMSLLKNIWYHRGEFRHALQNNQIWFTEWSENKIGKIYAAKKLPFSIITSPQKELSVNRG